MFNQRIKSYILIAVLIAAGWFVLNNHFIYSDKRIHLLKKFEPSLWYTFYSMDNKRPETIMKVDHLRYDGIGELLVEQGMLTEDQRLDLENKYNMEDE